MKALDATLKNAVHDRIKKTLNEQKKVLKKIKEGKPLEAEEDEFRKIAFINRRIGVDLESAKKIGNYVDPRGLNLSVAALSKAESLQGPTVDFINICFLDLARAASRSVARIVHPNGDPEGTGFMISPSLFITNHHVIGSKDDARYFQVEFNYELDFARKTLPNTLFKLNPERFFETALADDLDFTIVAIGDKISGPMTLDDIGFIPLINTPDKHIKAIFLNCIQHPNGDPKQLVIRENRLLARTNNTLIYSSDTLPGASGSPVFNDDWEVVALHHWGEPYKAVLDEGSNPGSLPKNGNEGIRISSIINHLNNIEANVIKGKELLKEALSVEFRPPSLIVRSKILPERIEKNDNGKRSISSPENTINVNNMKSESHLSFTVPLTISIQLGSPGQSQNGLNGASGKSDTNTVVERSIESLAEGFKPDTKYTNRKGYDSNFLGVNVNMPKLSEEQKQIAALNVKAKEGENPNEFKYQHFSVVMNAERKLAFFTAVNIDGGSVVKINRKTGEITRGPESMFQESAEAREKWFDDPRINDDEVCHDDLYKDVPQMKQFHRGHLVKRTDPSWGTEAKALKGQADTFHFLNCAPQHSKFNPNTSRWAGLENWITDTSDNDNIRVSVFSGPLFSEEDFVIRDIQVPDKFWKIVAWVENGELLATAVIADQSFLIDKAGSENFSVLPDKLPDDYHCSIEHLEGLTGLSFGTLSKHDTFPKSESIRPMKKFTRYDEIKPKKQNSSPSFISPN